MVDLIAIGYPDETTATAAAEGAEFAGAVVADGVDADELAVFGQLYRPGDDRDVGSGAGPPAAAGIGGAGEADHPGAVGEPGDREPGGGIPCPAGHLGAGQRLAWSSRIRWAWVATTTPACRMSARPPATTTSAGSPA